MGIKEASASTGMVLTFPGSEDGPDEVMERLVNDDPERRGRCISEWGDPLDAAILATQLVEQPKSDMLRRERIARRAGRDAEAGFWQTAASLLRCDREPKNA